MPQIFLQHPTLPRQATQRCWCSLPQPSSRSRSPSKPVLHTPILQRCPPLGQNRCCSTSSHHPSNNNAVMTPDRIRTSGGNDNLYTKLIHAINQGFPHKCSLTEPEIHNFWEVWHWLSTDRGLVLMDGKITLRNRRFLRKCKFKTTPKPIPSATPAAITPTINTPLLHPDPLTSSSNDTPKQTTHTLTHPWSSKIPRALSKLLPHNRPGLKERHSPHTTRPTRRRWGEMKKLLP